MSSIRRFFRLIPTVFFEKNLVFPKKIGFFENIWCCGLIIGDGIASHNELDDFTYAQLCINSKVAVYGNVMVVYVV